VNSGYVLVAEVVRVAERTEGVRLGKLLASLEPDRRALEETLNGLLYSRPGAGALIAKAVHDLARSLNDN
jgi:hypothetical protein